MDDFAIVTKQMKEMNEGLESIVRESEEMGLRIDVGKTKIWKTKNSRKGKNWLVRI